MKKFIYLLTFLYFHSIDGNLVQNQIETKGRRTCFCRLFTYNKFNARIIDDNKDFDMPEYVSCNDDEAEKCNRRCSEIALYTFSDRNKMCETIGEHNVIANDNSEFKFKNEYSYSSCMGYRENEKMSYTCCVPKCQCSIRFYSVSINNMPGEENLQKRINIDVPKRPPFACGYNDKDVCRQDCRKAALEYLGYPNQVDSSITELNILSFNMLVDNPIAYKLCRHIGTMPKPGLAAFIEFDNGYGAKERLFFGTLCCLVIDMLEFGIPGVPITVQQRDCTYKKLF